MSTNDEVKNRLNDGNAMFRKSVDPSLLARLLKNQAPFVAILACSDSRVSPEKVFNLSMGDAFVVRIAGNSVSDPAVLGSLEYAVEHLGVKTVVVLGHTDCGAVKAVMDGEDQGNLSRVMRDIERARSKIAVDLANDSDAIGEGNVRLQLRLLEDSSKVIMDAVNGSKLSLIGAMLDLNTGTVRFV